jgi:hypothetical protein
MSRAQARLRMKTWTGLRSAVLHQIRRAEQTLQSEAQQSSPVNANRALTWWYVGATCWWRRCHQGETHSIGQENNPSTQVITGSQLVRSASRLTCSRSLVAVEWCRYCGVACPVVCQIGSTWSEKGSVSPCVCSVCAKVCHSSGVLLDNSTDNVSDIVVS